MKAHTRASRASVPAKGLDRFRSLFDNTSDMVVLIAREADGGYRCLDANEAVSKMEGIPLDVIVGKRVDAIHPPQVYAEWKAIYDRALSQQAPLDVDHEVPSPLGARKRRTRFLSLGRDDEGRDLLLGVCQDLTDAHRATSEMRDFEDYRAAMNRLNAILDGDRAEETVLQESVAAIREIFAADRCFLSFPWDPGSAQAEIPFYAERPGAALPPFPRTLPLESEPVRAFLAEFSKRQEPMALGPEDLTGFAKEVLERAQVRSRLVVPIRPKPGGTWCLVLQQCGTDREWVSSEKILFKDLAVRIKSALEAFLLTRNLRRGQAFHNILTEMMPTLLWTLSSDGTVEFINQRFRDFTGLDLEGLRNGFPHLHPGDYAANRGRIDENVRAGKPIEAEMRIRRRDGAYVWHIVRAQPSFDPHGKIERWVGTCTDISEAKRLQEALLRSKEELEAIIGGVDEGISAQDAAGRIIYANRKYARISGFDSPEELLASPMAERADRYEMFDEDGAPIDFERLPGRRALQGESRASMIMRFRDRNLGREYWLNLKSTAVRDADGKVVMAINFSQDISEARRAREELLRSREQLETILAGITDGILAQTPEGRIVYANEAMAKLLGMPSAAALIEATDRALAAGAANTMAFFDEEGRPFPLDRLPTRLARLGQQPDAVLLRFRLAGQSKERWVVSQAKPIFGADGKVSLAIGMTQDVTELKEKEEAVRRLQKMDSLGKLAGGIAHDFNNLLVSINGYGDLGARLTEESDPLLHEYFEEIRKSGERAAALTQQLLAYSRRQIVQPRRLDLNAVVTDMRKLLLRLIGEDIELRTSLRAGLPAVKADASQMEQVIMNLVLNARDAMPKGGILTLETGEARIGEADLASRPEAKPGPHVVLTVSDNGIGMEPAVAERIFEPFFTTKEPGKGTGLGLASVYGIVDQWGGHIRVETRPGEGATFRILLPAAGEASGEEARQPAPSGSAPSAGTVLLVEDEPSVLKFSLHVLEARGYRVHSARNAAEAEAVAQACGSLDLVVTDVVMPDRRGPDLLGALRARRPGLKAILMSGYMDPDGMPPEERGRTEFLRKPFAPDVLAAMADRLLRPPSDP